ncbi:sugar ABC transporter permease [Pseudomonas sp. AU11447]|uniref:ABC transporter permease n=1 Tax=unclassified Pseudomonas TaxID=196821 RepID=UPI0006D49256|nr:MULTISPECIES: ABC transporter permease [unclassified Pseudomonas]OBY92652.1 sugar ABC transporter permease [Pseudomonas sp. AU11447]
MRHYSIAPSEIARSLWRNRSLILQLTRREIAGRYKGSFFGTFWSFFNPILMLTVYTFVFSVVFKARWGGSGASKSEFALILFAGLIIFNIFSETFTKAPNIILYSTNYVKKIIFPLEILPVVSLATAMFHGLVSLLVWLIFHSIIFGMPHPEALYFPLVILPLILATLGLSWLLASAGVYLRDVSQVIGILTTALMFLSPIFYPLSSLPAELQPLFLINPLTSTIEQSRAVLIFGQQPNWQGLGISMLISCVILWLGFAWFQKTRKGFADVL